MTREEYNKKIKEYGNQLRDNYSDDLYNEVSEFQRLYMEDWLERYKATIGDSKAKEYVYELIDYLTHWSESGSSLVYVETSELANEVLDELDREFGECLLEWPEVYKEDDEWVVDCIFGGNWCPYWDGWYWD